MNAFPDRVRALRASLVDHFGAGCVVHSTDAPTMLAIETPLARYDDENIMVFVIPGPGTSLLVHDGGRILRYLWDLDINLLSTKSAHVNHMRYFRDLQQRHGVRISEEHLRIETELTSDSGEQLLTFVECLIALSFLVVLKKTGITPLKQQSIQHLSELGATIAKALPQLRVRTGIRATIGDTTTEHPWGVSVDDPKRNVKCCLQLIGGDTRQKVLESTLVTGGLFLRCKDVLGIDERRFIALYDGPKEFLAQTSSLMEVYRNGTTPLVITRWNYNAIIDALAERLELPERNNIDTDVKVSKAEVETFINHFQRLLGEKDQEWSSDVEGPIEQMVDTRPTRALLEELAASEPIASYRGNVLRIGTPTDPDTALIEYQSGVGTRFAREFPVERLAEVQADFVGARVEYRIYSAGRFNLTEVRNVGLDYNGLLHEPVEEYTASDFSGL